LLYSADVLREKSLPDLGRMAALQLQLLLSKYVIRGGDSGWLALGVEPVDLLGEGSEIERSPERSVRLWHLAAFLHSRPLCPPRKDVLGTLGLGQVLRL
jgi:hypothetical protein